MNISLAIQRLQWQRTHPALVMACLWLGNLQENGAGWQLPGSALFQRCGVEPRASLDGTAEAPTASLGLWQSMLDSADGCFSLLISQANFFS